jgi:hypothetical protein
LVLALSANPLGASDDNGGAKRNPVIEVRNDFGFPVGVILDANEDDLRDAADDADPQAAFEDLGGVIVNPGQTIELDAKAGANEIFVIDAGDFTNVAVASINVDHGETQQLTVIDFEESISLIVSSPAFED